MGNLGKNTPHRATGGSLGFYVGLILSGALMLMSLPFAPRNVMIFAWGFILVVPAVAYVLLSAVPQRKAMAAIVAVSLAGVIVSSCYIAPRRSLAENLIWLFLALLAILMVQIVSGAGSPARLDAIIDVIALLTASHMGTLWLLIPRDVNLAFYGVRVAAVVAAGAIVLLFPLPRPFRVFVVIFTTTLGFAFVGYVLGGMDLLEAVCVGFTCGLLILSGVRYVPVLAERKRAAHYDGVLNRRRRNIRAQLLSGALTILCVGVTSYFLGIIFVL